MIFVDSNVLLYTIDATEPDKQAVASGWLDFLWAQGNGALSTQVLNEFYINATQKVRFGLKQDSAWKMVKSLYGWKPRAIDCDLLEQAYEIQSRYRLSWWDSLIAAAAIDQRCKFLLSEDLQDGLNLGGTVVRNPFRFSPDDLLQESVPSELNQPKAKSSRKR